MHINRYGLRVLAAILGLGSLMIFVGCSSDNANPLKTSESQVAAEAPSSSTPYPPITEADLATLLPNIQVLSTVAPRSGEQLDDQSSQLIHYQQGGTVSHRNCGVQIGAWQLRSDQTVTVSTPVPGRAVVDYYPHPYQFNGCIRIWIDLHTIQLPAGRRWDEVQFWYQNSDGTMTRYYGVIDLNTMTYSAWPDHFSRYILGLPAN